ncbi:hypothetical protein HZA99_01935 [Candidatus Woesearchaeota archaeon]|nr:hypothetical protein [Candidatus Woesearchaeota archaeon]
MSETETKQILDELRVIRSDLDYIKGHLSDIDLVLTDDDKEAIESAENDWKTKKTKRLI